MRALRVCWEQGVRWSARAVACCAFWLAMAAPLLAQPPAQPAQEAPSATIPNWVLTILGIALMMLAVCKPVHRQDQPKARYD